MTSTEVTTPVTAQATTTITGTADIRINKTVDHATISSPTTLHYTITVTNVGTLSLTGVRVTDTFAGGATYISGDADNDLVLDPNEVWTYSADYNATQSDINAGNDLVNTATVDTDQTEPAQSTARTRISRNASLTVVKTQTSTNPISAVGDVITYRIVITNTGNINITGAVATEIYPGSGLGTLSTPPIESISNNGILDVGETWTHTATYRVTQHDIDLGVNLVNTISLVTNEVPGPTEDTAVTPVAASPMLTIDKTAAETGYDSSGDIIHYTIVVRNTGNVTLTGIIVTDPLTGFNQLIPSLAPGASQTLNTSYRVDQDDVNAGEVVNLAIAAYNYAGQEHFIDDEVTVYGTQGPDLSITKSASPVTYSTVNQSIIYRVVVTNTGNVTLTNVDVNDPLTGLDETIPILTPGESRVFNSTYLITQADLNRSFVNNTATARYTFNSTPHSESASARITANLSPAIDISKSVQESNYSSVGAVLHYTLVVRNTGNVTLTAVSVTDPLTGVDQTIGSLDPGETVTINATYTVTQVDINTGRVTNTARASTVYNGTTYSDQASAIVPANQNPRIEITKTATESNYTSAGEVIHYTLVVSNTGNVTLTGVTVTDPIANVSCPGVIGTLDPGEVVTCSATHTVTASDISDRSIHNTATATGHDPGGQPVSATASATVALRNLPPAIICPDPIITSTSETTCDVLISTGLNASYSDPNDNVVSLTWVMTGATEDQSPSSGINQIGSHIFNLGVTTVTYTVTDAIGLSATCSFTVTVNDNTPACCRLP